MKILFISLGCDKNLADSEEMLGLLTAGGHEITDDETQADAIVINTCCFIKDAKRVWKPFLKWQSTKKQEAAMH